MTMRASAGTTPGPTAPAGNGLGDHDQAAPADVVKDTPGAAPLCLPRLAGASCRALTWPLAASGVFALLLVVVVPATPRA